MTSNRNLWFDICEKVKNGNNNRTYDYYQFKNNVCRKKNNPLLLYCRFIIKLFTFAPVKSSIIIFTIILNTNYILNESNHTFNIDCF